MNRPFFLEFRKVLFANEKFLPENKSQTTKRGKRNDFIDLLLKLIK